jgi:peptide/nickel transport system substrate-binding protein
MNALKVLALVLVAALLTVQIVDGMRVPQQLHEVYTQQQQVNQALQQQQQQLKALQDEVAALKAAGVAAPAVAAAPTAGVVGSALGPLGAHGDNDGKAKLDVDFLLPYDASHWHPEWVGGNLTYFEETPKGINPIIDNDATVNDINGLVSDSLCSHHPAHPELWYQSLATAVVISDDYKTYTFTLRHGVKWQRPAIAKQAEYAWMDRDVELTAGDFVFTLEMIMNPDVEAPAQKSYYDDLASFSAPDPYTLRLVWKRKVYTSLEASMGISPMPRHIYTVDRTGKPFPANRVGAEFNHHWFDEMHQSVGVGAYTLDRWESDKTISFRRNPAYWGEGLHFDTITWDGEVKQPDAQLVAFKNGQVGCYTLIPQQYSNEILDHHEARFAAPNTADPHAGRAGELGWEKVRSSSYSYIGWNMRDPLFADARVRQALSCAFPQQRLIDEVYHGLGRPQRGPVHPDSPYFDPNLPYFAFDLERAKRLLKEAGWSDSDGDGWLDKDFGGTRRSLRFTIKYGAHSPSWDSVLQIYREQLRAIGIEMTPQSFEWKELSRIHEDKDFEATVGGWEFGLDVDFDQLWHSKHANEPKSSNNPGFADPRVDALSDQLRTSFALDQRIAIARQIEDIIQEAQPYTFFRSTESVFAWQNRGPHALAGVTDGFDRFHPLFGTEKLFWHLAKP